MGKRSLYIETYGCQMNEYDSDRIKNALDAESTDKPDKADIIIVNTCAIREKADQKAFSSVGKYKHLKKRNPELIIGISGCVAQLYGDKLLHRMPHVDFVLGPRAIPKLPALISEIEHTHKPSVETSFDIEEVFEFEPYHVEGKVTAFVSIQQGCNKRCTYCIVPNVRGSEVNRPLENILRETRSLVSKGAKEITLIGQTVNSWKQNGYKFGDLLSAVSDIEDLERIRFTTSYPRDVTKKMLEAMRNSEKVCRHIHLPVQSGSDKILSAMQRTYSSEWYRDAVERLRDYVPEIAISTDIIVGFPGESDADFEETMELMRVVEFDAAFSFIYSPRPHTLAAAMHNENNVESSVAKKRLATLQALQKDTTHSKNIKRVGETEAVLVEGSSKNDENMSWYKGRTTHNRITNFESPVDLTGKIVNVKISEGLLNSLRGELVV